MDIPKIPTLNISNKALTDMRRNAAAMENFSKAIESKAGKELLAVIDQYNEVLKIAGTIEQADIYAAKTRKNAEDEAAKGLSEVQRQLGIFNTDMANQNKLLDERSAKLTSDIATNDGRKADLDGRDRFAGVREKAVADREALMDKKSDELVGIAESLSNREDSLARAEAGLKTRADRIAAAVA